MKYKTWPCKRCNAQKRNVGEFKLEALHDSMGALTVLCRMLHCYLLVRPTRHWSTFRTQPDNLEIPATTKKDEKTSHNYTDNKIQQRNKISFPTKEMGKRRGDSKVFETSVNVTVSAIKRIITLQFMNY